MALIYCSDCGKQISDKAVACPQCGASVSASKAQQSSDSNTPSGANIQVVNVQAPTLPGYVKECDWTVTLLMSVFLGWLGVDRFMMGHGGLGVLKLLTFGGFGLWWAIDIVLIATKSVHGVVWKD